MRLATWLTIGIGVGAVAYIVANTPPKHATGSDTLEEGARKATGWGAKQRVGGAGTSVLGKVKEGVGKLTGDPDLQDEGVGQQVLGQVKDAAGQVAEAAGQTLHDLNR